MIGGGSLQFARCGRRTRLAHSRVTAPVALVRPFELPDGRLVVQLVTLGPGLCGGDAVDLDVTVEDGCEVVLTTTAATRVMSMDQGTCAEQHVRVRIGPEASFEYYPALAIPFPGSTLTQTLSIDADATARIGVVESWTFGRSARDEYLAFDSLQSRTTLTVDGTLVYADALHLNPAQDDVANAGVLDGRRYLAAGVFTGVESLSPGRQPDDSPHLDVALALSRPGVAYLRALANDGPALDAAVQDSLERVARAWGRAAVRLDRFRC